jgi:hypothetical protein
VEPICEFKDIMQAVGTMQEWQHLLGLDDWTIKLSLVEPHELVLDDCDGECEYTLICKSACIRILKPEYYGDRIIKYCAERILVHELLHCKLCLLKTDDSGFNQLMHQTHEDIARALICAKYGITYSWFQDINYDDEIHTEEE